MTIQLSENLRELRKQHHLTQEQLAEALGVTPGAVHKWETGKATPELETLVELAVYFETSVDALLNYGWEKLTAAKAVTRLRQFSHTQQSEEGTLYAEKVLLRFPNNFDVVYRSANLYFLTLNPERMPRAVALYQHALDLLDQNTDPQISRQTIQNHIASCYCYLNRMDDAIAILKQNNADGCNDYLIGSLLSQQPGHAEEALPYLSDALISCHKVLYNTCLGYANALNNPDEVADLILLLYQFGQSLRIPGKVSWMDRGDVKLFLILAEMDRLRGQVESTKSWLKKAYASAQRFDAAPTYLTADGLKFYYGRCTASSYDDMGKTAMDIIRNFLDSDSGEALRPFWETIQEEIP